MNNKFLLLDVSHLGHRIKHVIKGTPEEIVGMTLHSMFASIGKLWRIHNCDHLVFVFDGHSWRKSIYPPYKRNRSEAKAEYTPKEQELEELFFNAFEVFKIFVSTKTNCTILDNPILEADDLIAGFIQENPNDEHIIVSSDKDFEQLLAPNVIMYNGVSDQTITPSGVFDWQNKPVIDKKTGLPKVTPTSEWSVFEKAVRGCSTDNIFSAYPGVREKGSKTKVGLREAFEDRNKQGFAWSSMMMTRWVDHEGNEHRVLDDYNRNLELVDLSKQPEEIKSLIQETVKDACYKKNNPQIGLYFLKFCGKYELVKIGDQNSYFTTILSTAYPPDK
jgi:5'-3' exonuclease